METLEDSSREEIYQVMEFSIMPMAMNYVCTTQIRKTNSVVDLSDSAF